MFANFDKAEMKARERRSKELQEFEDRLEALMYMITVAKNDFTEPADIEVLRHHSLILDAKVRELRKNL